MLFYIEIIRFQTEQVSEKRCLCLQINFYLANTHRRGDNLKANVDGKSECQLFLTEFALILRFEIGISFESKRQKRRTLLLVCPIHTKSKPQYPKV